MTRLNTPKIEWYDIEDPSRFPVATGTATVISLLPPDPSYPFLPFFLSLHDTLSMA